MANKTKYESPFLEIVTMPLEGVICGSGPDTGGMDFGNPFGGDTEEGELNTELPLILPPYSGMLLRIE